MAKVRGGKKEASIVAMVDRWTKRTVGDVADSSLETLVGK